MHSKKRLNDRDSVPVPQSEAYKGPNVMVVTGWFLLTNSHQCWQRPYWRSSCDLTLHAAITTRQVSKNVTHHSSTPHEQVAFITLAFVYLLIYYL